MRDSYEQEHYELEQECEQFDRGRRRTIKTLRNKLTAIEAENATLRRAVGLAVHHSRRLGEGLADDSAWLEVSTELLAKCLDGVK